MNTSQKIKKIAEETDNKLEKYVAESILDAGDNGEVISYITDLLSHGCQSGMVGELIHYKDTREFFNTFESEIEDIRAELEDSIGEPLKIGTPASNWLAWFGYEETARNIAQKVGLE